MDRVIKISRDNLIGTDIIVSRDRSKGKRKGGLPLYRTPDRITKRLRESVKDQSRPIELIGTFKQQCMQIRDLHKTPGTNFVVTLSQGTAIKSTAKPKEVWRPVTKRKREVNQLRDLKILREIWNAKRSR